MKADRIIELANAFYGSCVLFAASDLGLFAALDTRGEAEAPALADRARLGILSGRPAGWLEEAGFQGFSMRAVPPPTPHWLARAYRP